MTTEQTKDIARRYFEEIWNNGNLDAINSLVSADAMGHAAGLSLQGLDVLRQRVSSFRTAYPDLKFTIEDLFVENGKALVRWIFNGTQVGEYMGHAGTGRSVSVTGMNVFHIAHGKIIEIWTNGDDLSELQQLGIIPALT